MNDNGFPVVTIVELFFVVNVTPSCPSLTVTVASLKVCVILISELEIFWDLINVKKVLKIIQVKQKIIIHRF